MLREILRAENLTYTYSRGTPFEKVALKDVSFSAQKGEFIGLIGHTGSGKSTLIKHFNGLLKPETGRVLINGEDIFGSKELTRAARFVVGMAFQYPEYQLFEESVFADIAFGPKNMGLDQEEIERRVLDAAQIVGLSGDQLKKSPFELSGGEKRRAALAGIFAMEPEILVLDEPMAGLDPKGRQDVLRFITEYHQRHGVTVIFVSHSMEDVARIASKIVVMSDAGILTEGTPEQIFGKAEMLIESGLNVPRVTQVLLALKRRGFDVDTTCYTVEQAARELLLRKRGSDA